MNTHEELITFYKMQRHPEGGYFASSFRSEHLIPQAALSPKFQGARPWSSAIYYLLQKGEKSCFHRIASEEVWHFYEGDPLAVVEITEEGKILETILGRDFKSGQKFQHTVPSGRWFGSYLPEGSTYSFVGCTVAPGFDFADFEMADYSKLLSSYPDLKRWIDLLAKKST